MSRPQTQFFAGQIYGAPFNPMLMTSVRHWSIAPTSAGMRLDLFLCGQLAQLAPPESLSRSEIQRLIGEGQITLNGAVTKASARVKAQDRVDLRSLPVRETELKPEPIPLDVLYEDQDCLVINKAPGIVVHPAAGQPTGTLVNALLHYCSDLAGVGGERRPGIVHRLDKETSGVMVVAKNMSAFHNLQSQFKTRAVRKEYLAIAWGAIFPTHGRIDRPVGRHRSDRKRMSSLYFLNKARPALTEWRVEERFTLNHDGSHCLISLVRLLPQTGRTHQLRVHLADMGFPLVGDKVYGQQRKSVRQRVVVDPLLAAFHRHALHAEKLAFNHVRTGQRMEFCAPLAEDIRELLGYLRRMNTGKPMNSPEISRRRG